MDGCCRALYFHLSRCVVDNGTRYIPGKFDCNAPGDGNTTSERITVVLVFNGYTGKVSLIDSWYQKSVFVGITESIETPNERILSLVRFYPIENYIRSVWAGQLDFTVRVERFTDPVVNLVHELVLNKLYDYC